MTNQLAFSIAGQQIKVPQQIQGLANPSNYGDFGGALIGKLIAIAFAVAAIIALFVIVLGGFKWITSQGDPKEISGARNTIIYAAIGLGVVFLSFFIVNLLSSFLGIPLLGR